MSEPGDVVGRYTLVSHLGQGGMGTVWRARDARLGRMVALKLVRPGDRRGRASQAELTERLLREARAAAALTHPHVVSIFDVGVEDGVAYVAMELVEGRTLRDLVRGDTPVEARMRWLRQVADALRAAHELGIVHRDIKPDNVVVRDGGDAKVLDFGLARATPVAPDQSSFDGETAPHLAAITRDGAALGTPAYMSPEQIRGERVDGRSDQFAWGVTAYEVLSGARPWPEGLATLGLAAPILTGPPIRGDRARVPEPAASVIERALRRDPDDRFASMRDLLGALDVPRQPHRSTTELAPTVRSPALNTSAPPPPIAVPEELGEAPGPRALLPSPGADPARRRSRVSGVAVGALAVALAACGAFLVGRAKREPSSGAATSSPASAGPRTLAEEPPPSSTNPQAVASYRRGRLHQRDCEWTRAIDAFESAVALAPDFGEAQLQLAIARFHVSYLVGDEVRRPYGAAVELRRTLAPRDRELLEVYEPLFVRDPPDWPAALARVRDLARARPDDAEIQLRAASLRAFDGDLDVEREVVSACRLDPEYADAWAMRITVEAVADRPNEARAAIETCHRLAPASPECSVNAVQAHAHFGRCADAEKEARRLVDTPMGWVHGPLLLELGHSRTAVETAFERYWSSSALPHPRHLVELGDRWVMAMHDGSFDTAMELGQRYVDAAMASPTVGFEGFRWSALVAWVVAAAEAGELASIAPRVRDVLAREREWRADAPHNGVQALLVWSRLVRAGLATDDELQVAREAYRSRFASLFAAKPTLAWAVVDCAGVELGTDAERAARALPEKLRPGELFVDDAATAWIGIALSRAGMHREALEWLKRAAASCYRVSWPHPFADVDIELGATLTALGDAAGACDAYATVVDRWGKATPRSTSAREAAARMAKMACPSRGP